MNPYVGRNQLDGATLDRYAVITHDNRSALHIFMADLCFEAMYRIGPHWSIFPGYRLAHKATLALCRIA